MRINNTEIKHPNFQGLGGFAGPLAVFHNKNAILPTLLIETGVTTGRSFEANKTGGKLEAQERFIEQGTSAVVWLWGVQALKKLGESILKKAFKVDNMNFDIGFDYLRNPLENIDKKLIALKTGNILASTLIATAFIGFVLPKINHFLTKKVINKDKKEKTVLKPTTIEEFQKYSKGKNVSFTSLLQGAEKFAHLLENNSTARLLITDTGVVGGRYYNARNKYEKIENLFRDISSIYFYLFSTKHIVKGLNKLTSNADITPKVLNELVEMLSKKAKETNTTDKDFIKKALGSISKERLNRIDELFKGRKTISLEEFINVFDKQNIKALKISELQPLLKGKSTITKQQAKDIISRGWITNADFLHNVYNAFTNGNYNKKEKFVSAKSLDKMRISMENFIIQLNKAMKKQGGKLSEDLIRKTARKNIMKNFAFYSAATIISTYALAVIIPKIQYFIRRKLTNNYEFVGIKDYK